MSPVAAVKGDRGLADILFSRIVRSRSACILCGEREYGLLQTAHIIGRTYSATRCDEANAFCACARDHHRWTNHPDEWMEFVAGSIGMGEYLRLKRKAETGIPLSSALFWRAEVERLKDRCVELGLDTRRRIPA